MYTIQDYIVDIKEKATELEEFLSKFDTTMINGILELLVTGEFFNLKRATDTYESKQMCLGVEEQLKLSRIINTSQEDVLQITPYSKLAEILCYVIYLRRFPEEATDEVVNHILMAYSELNPHKSYLASIYNEIEKGNYNQYMIMTKLTSACFIQYPKHIMKIMYNKHLSLSKEALCNELRVALLAEGKDVAGIKYLKSFYSPTSASDSTQYFAILLYEGARIYEADASFFASATSSMFNKVLQANQNVLDFYPENKDLHLEVDVNTVAIEPMYINNGNEENYYNINCPFILTDVNLLKEMFI